MPTAMFVQEGNAIDYTPAAAVAAGDVVVLGDLVCVAKQAIAANRLGSLATGGVFDLPKAAGAGTAITAGAKLYWDAGAKQATTNAAAGANKQAGYAAKAAADGDATVRLLLCHP